MKVPLFSPYGLVAYIHAPGYVRFDSSGFVGEMGIGGTRLPPFVWSFSDYRSERGVPIAHRVTHLWRWNKAGYELGSMVRPEVRRYREWRVVRVVQTGDPGFRWRETVRPGTLLTLSGIERIERDPKIPYDPAARELDPVEKSVTTSRRYPLFRRVPNSDDTPLVPGPEPFQP